MHASADLPCAPRGHDARLHTHTHRQPIGARVRAFACENACRARACVQPSTAKGMCKPGPRPGLPAPRAWTRAVQGQPPPPPRPPARPPRREGPRPSLRPPRRRRRRRRVGPARAGRAPCAASRGRASWRVKCVSAPRRDRQGRHANIHTQRQQQKHGEVQRRARAAGKAHRTCGAPAACSSPRARCPPRHCRCRAQARGRVPDGGESVLPWPTRGCGAGRGGVGRRTVVGEASGAGAGAGSAAGPSEAWAGPWRQRRFR
jgi:hypothetical protein